MIYRIPPQNYALAARTGLGAFYVQRGRRGLRGLGLAPIIAMEYGKTGIPTSTPLNTSRSLRPIAYHNPTSSSTSGTAPIVTSPIVTGPVTATTAPTTGSGSSWASSKSTAAQVSGTPVPVGYDLNSVYIAANGAQWEYSSGQGVWINVGTPYNLNAASAATPASSTAATSSTAAQVSGTPVPVGYPTSSQYVDASGNTWAYNPSYGVWTVTATSASAAAALTAGSAAAAPAATTTVATSDYQSILDWLSESTLTSSFGVSVPNWLVVAAAGLVALKFMHPAGGKR